jgi:hypothetical protein
MSLDQSPYKRTSQSHAWPNQSFALTLPSPVHALHFLFPLTSERIHIVKRTRSTQSPKKPVSEQKIIQPLQLSPLPRKTTQKNMFHQSKQFLTWEKENNTHAVSFVCWIRPEEKAPGRMRVGVKVENEEKKDHGETPCPSVPSHSVFFVLVCHMPP